MNKFMCIANLTKEPEMKYSQSGTAFTKFSIAVNDGYGEKKQTSFLNCTAFNKTAEAVANYTHKGSKVFIEGKVQTGSYDRKDGTGKNYTFDIIVNQIEFLDSKKDGQAKPDDDVFEPTDENPFEDSEDSIPF